MLDTALMYAFIGFVYSNVLYTLNMQKERIEFRGILGYSVFIVLGTLTWPGLVIASIFHLSKPRPKPYIASDKEVEWANMMARFSGEPETATKYNCKVRW